MELLRRFIREALVVPKDIVVSVPKARQAEIEAEEADVARREAAGEKGISYYWSMGRLPKEQPRRLYFAWDGAVRAYHDVIGIDRDQKCIYMATKINQVEPIPMSSFRGFRYLR